MQKTKIWYARALLNDSTNTGTRLYHCIKWNFERTSALSFHYICHYIKHNLGRKLARRRRKILGGFKVICTSELYSREENKPAAGWKFLEVFKCFTLRKCIFSEGIRVFQRSKSSKFSACGGLSPPRWGGKKLYSPPKGPDPGGGIPPPGGRVLGG